jgi:hypothetical protein
MAPTYSRSAAASVAPRSTWHKDTAGLMASLCQRRAAQHLALELLGPQLAEDPPPQRRQPPREALSEGRLPARRVSSSAACLGLHGGAKGSSPSRTHLLRARAPEGGERRLVRRRARQRTTAWAR